MYPTEEEIEECLVDVDEEELVAFLDQSEELAYLSRAIVKEALFKGKTYSTEIFLKECVTLIEGREWELATKIAREKKERATFSCEMQDEFN